MKIEKHERAEVRAWLGKAWHSCPIEGNCLASRQRNHRTSKMPLSRIIVKCKTTQIIFTYISSHNTSRCPTNRENSRVLFLLHNYIYIYLGHILRRETWNLQLHLWILAPRTTNNLKTYCLFWNHKRKQSHPNIQQLFIHIYLIFSEWSSFCIYCKNRIQQLNNIGFHSIFIPAYLFEHNNNLSSPEL